MAVADVSSKLIPELTSLAGRCAVITGGAQGLGKAAARRLAEAGAALVIADLKCDIAKAAAEELAREFGIKAIASLTDVTDGSAVATLAELAVRELGGIDIWVNNAGVFPNQRLLETSDADWDRVMAINLRGVFLGAREAARRMIDAGRGGVIVNIVSTAGFKGIAPGIGAYVASKHGVRGLTRQLAIELAPHDIRVLGVAPTHCDTEGTLEAVAAMSNANVNTEISALVTSKLGRVGVPDDIARVVLFAASDMAMFMTGSTLLADAGEVA